MVYIKANVSHLVTVGYRTLSKDETAECPDDLAERFLALGLIEVLDATKPPPSREVKVERAVKRT